MNVSISWQVEEDLNFLYIATLTAKNAKLVLYADDTSFVLTNPSPIEFANKIKFSLMLMNGLGIICYP
jgi:hypothetical protein